MILRFSPDIAYQLPIEVLRSLSKLYMYMNLSVRQLRNNCLLCIAPDVCDIAYQLPIEVLRSLSKLYIYMNLSVRQLRK